MFCPNCGNNCGDANFCSRCGHDLKGTVVAVSATNEVRDERAEMIRKYEKYMPNKLAAIKALMDDTGMNLKDADRTIKELFKSELENSDQVRCPNCRSTSISANQKGFGFGRAAIGAAFGLDVGLLVGGIGAKKVICTCLNCGYQWKPGKK